MRSNRQRNAAGIVEQLTPRTRRQKAVSESQSPGKIGSLRLRSIQDGLGSPLSPLISIHEPFNESLVSASTASLPQNHTIQVALRPGDHLTATQSHNLHILGSEALTDGWRRDSEGEGLLEDLRAQTKRRIIFPGRVDDAHLASPARKPWGGKIWYTASFLVPCTCERSTHQFAWSPRVPPPSLSRLPQLATVSAAEIPLVGDGIPEWTNLPAAIEGDEVGVLEEFKVAWPDANGQGWGDEQMNQFAGGCDEVEDISMGRPTAGPSRNNSIFIANGPYLPSSASTLVTPLDYDAHNAPKLVSPRTSRKGKEKATNNGPVVLGPVWKPLNAGGDQQDESSLDDGQVLFPELRPSRSEYNGNDAAAGKLLQTDIPVPASSWEEEAKRRKKWWRREIDRSNSYGQLWTMIPLPHSIDARYSEVTATLVERPPDYVLPRFFKKPSRPHPFHPNLASYIQTRPKARVHWLIPIHGPVHIPGYSDVDHSPLRPTSMSSADGPPAPVPSAGSLTPRYPISNGQVDSQTGVPSKLLWTPRLLQHVWKEFLLPRLQADPKQPFGPCSIRLSGPKPDPYIALRPAPPLEPTLWSSTTPVDTTHGDTHDTRPVRPEIGDHIRIYCDADRALSLRMLLNGIEVEPSILDADDSMYGGRRPSQSVTLKRGRYSPFGGSDKIRLVLVGERGEALVVA